MRRRPATTCGLAAGDGGQLRVVMRASYGGGDDGLASGGGGDDGLASGGGVLTWCLASVGWRRASAGWRRASAAWRRSTSGVVGLAPGCGLCRYGCGRLFDVFSESVCPCVVRSMCFSANDGDIFDH
jgi:hypothetical protein